jgi:hypothetical protein
MFAIYAAGGSRRKKALRQLNITSRSASGFIAVGVGSNGSKSSTMLAWASTTPG